MKKIKLTQGKWALVDDEDFEWLNQWKWYAHNEGHTHIANRHAKNIEQRGKNKQISMHREILNAPEGMVVDHKNGNGLDNRKKNIWICTRFENGQNKVHLAKNNKTGTTGIWYYEKKQRFVVQFIRLGVRYYLGGYKTLRKARRVLAEAKPRKKSSALNNNRLTMNKKLFRESEVRKKQKDWFTPTFTVFTTVLGSGTFFGIIIYLLYKL